MKPVCYMPTIFMYKGSTKSTCPAGDSGVDGEAVLVCLAQEMAILLHKLHMGNVSKLNEEQRNRCLIKTEGCIVMFVCCLLKLQDQKQKI